MRIVVGTQFERKIKRRTEATEIATHLMRLGRATSDFHVWLGAGWGSKEGSWARHFLGV